MTETMKITQTSQRGLEPVSSKLVGQFEHLRSLLKQRLGPDHAFLFAEPVQLGSARETAWFVDALGEATRVVDLPPEQRQAAATRVSVLVNDIRNLAEQLGKQGDAGRDLARILVDSLILPAADRLWSVGGRPVMVDWGWKEATDVATPRDVLTLIATEAAPAPRVPRAEAKAAEPAVSAVIPVRTYRIRTLRDWLTPALWTLFVVLLLTIGWLLLKACSIGGANWPDFLRALLPDACPIAASATDLRVRAAEQAMRAAEMDLLRAQARCQRECPVPAVVTPPAERDAAPNRAEINRGLQDANLAHGRLEVTLGWNGTADLDLSVVCPDGKTIDYSTRTNCGGVLDFDRNSNAITLSSTPIEHISWIDEPSLRGTYTVMVNLYSLRPGASLPVPYRVVVTRGEQVVQEKTGVLNATGGTDMPLTFQVPTAP